MSFRPTPAKGGGEPESSPRKGTGNFFEDEKVASPLLDARVRGNDDQWSVDSFIDLLRQDTKFASRKMPQLSNGKLTGWLRSADRSAARVTSITCRACSGVTSTGRSSATASMK